MTKQWDAQPLRDWILAQREPLVFRDVRAAARRFGAPNADRAADRELQKQRRAGLICHRAQMWVRVDANPKEKNGGISR